MRGPLLVIRLDLEQVLVGIDRFLDRLPIREHAPEPAIVDVVLIATLGLGHDRGGGLPFRSYKEHTLAIGNRFANAIETRAERRQGLIEVQDMRPIPRAEDMGPHEGIPTVGLVAEVGPDFEQGTNTEVGLLQGPGQALGGRRFGIGGRGIAPGRRRRRRRLGHS